MNNDRKVYVIRTLGFGYTDEYYYPLFNPDSNEGHVCAVFEDKQTALKEWKRLEYEFSHQMSFENVTEFDQLFFFLERLGIDSNKAFFENLHVMNQDELFELIEKLERHVFYMYEYPADLKLKTLFNLTENRFESWDATEELWDGTEGLSNNIIITYDNITEITINGTLEELSEAPLLL